MSQQNQNNNHDGTILPVRPVADLPEEESPRSWLIEGLWSAAAVGIVCGNPKSGKTWIGLDMAVSVATGTPCLGRYKILEPGRALVYLAEDSLPALRDRISSIGRSRGIQLAGMDLHVITVPRLRLDAREDRTRLMETVRHHRPRLLLLDPLVRLHGVNENDAQEISELLSFLRDLQRSFDVAVVLVHHARKGGSQVGGQALRGSGDLWAWGDSNWYLRHLDGKLVLSIEHRSARAPDPVTLRLVDDDEEQVHLEIEGPAQARDVRAVDEQILELLAKEAPLTRSQIRERLRVKNERLGSALVELQRQNRIVRRTEGWRLTSQPPGLPDAHQP
jgi:AAA domain